MAGAAAEPPDVGEMAMTGGEYALPEEVRCLLCREILYEPVVLPCDPRHRLCGPCFGDVQEKSELSCPFCRKRLSNWIRRNRTSLVDEQLWWHVQNTYPVLVAARRAGVDLDIASSVDAAATAPQRSLAAEGELFSEYRETMRKHEEERRRAAERELEESRPLLEALASDCDADADALRRMQEAEEADREYAQSLQRQLESEMASEAGPAADPAVIEADRDFAKKLQESLNSTLGDGRSMTTALPGRRDETPPAPGVPGTSSLRRRHSGGPQSASKQAAKSGNGKKSRQMSLASHVRVIAADNDANTCINPDTGQMRKCPMCDRAFLMDVLLEHAAVCDGTFGGQSTHKSPVSPRPGSSVSSGGRKRLAGPKNEESGVPERRVTLDRFVVKQRKTDGGDPILIQSPPPPL
eukprot:m.212428 g.212428  ORF g.212428 m.212428 type:complete len:410 (-) comp26114_c0_seq1:56-1285(-)